MSFSSASSSGKRSFARIDRLPPYGFNITAELRIAARWRGEDIIDMSMGNPDGATPAHIVAKLTEVAQRPDTHGYWASKGIPRLRRAHSPGGARLQGDVQGGWIGGGLSRCDQGSKHLPVAPALIQEGVTSMPDTPMPSKVGG
jgi:hypothetical protein